jgi:hypothetical protein
MRIISGHDYYDTALAYGRDDDIVFVRQKEKIRRSLQIPGVLYPDFSLAFKGPDSHSDHFAQEDIITNNHTFFADPLVVWLCGKRYGGVKWSGFKGTVALTASYFWTRAELEQIVNDMGYRLRVHVPRKRRGQEQHLADHFTKRDFPAATKYLIENKITIATILPKGRDGHYVVRIDGDNLKQIEFYMVLNAYQAFQEISQWVGNLPKDGNPMVVITDDKVKIHKAGFDVKTSFRKRKAIHNK